MAKIIEQRMSQPFKKELV